MDRKVIKTLIPMQWTIPKSWQPGRIRVDTPKQLKSNHFGRERIPSEVLLSCAKKHNPIYWQGQGEYYVNQSGTGEWQEGRRGSLQGF